MFLSWVILTSFLFFVYCLLVGFLRLILFLSFFFVVFRPRFWTISDPQWRVCDISRNSYIRNGVGWKNRVEALARSCQSFGTRRSFLRELEASHSRLLEVVFSCRINELAIIWDQWVAIFICHVTLHSVPRQMAFVEPEKRADQWVTLVSKTMPLMICSLVTPRNKM